MHSHDIAWAAGLFEGEGYISKERVGGKSSHRLAINLTDKDVLEKFVSVVGFGSVRELHNQLLDKKVKEGKWKPCFVWEINNKKETRRILDMFLPYFGDRRAHRAMNMLDKIELS